jgi:molybdate transport system ATP-binding protein
VSAPRLEIRLRLPLAHFELDVDVQSSARTLGVFGPSGAGKSSLVEAIAGWRRPLAGRIRLGDSVLFDSVDGTSLAIERRGIGYVPQDALLLPHWSVHRNLFCGARGTGTGEIEAHVERTAAMLEIGHLLQRSCTQLSGGERQRVALARALASRPRCLLLDEPLGSLDLPLRRRILPYLIRVREQVGLPTVFVSHDATEVQALCDEVVVLEEGRVRSQGEPGEVLRHVRSGERAFENVLSGGVSAVQAGTALVQLDGGGCARVPAAGLAAGERAVFALGSDEILVALDAPTHISARNVLPARIELLEDVPPSEVRVDARLEDGCGARLSASLTRASREELRLTPGLPVFLVFKTTSCRVLSAPLAAQE